MPMLAQIGENARFFALLFEALERALKVLVVMDYDFRQNLLPPFVAFVRLFIETRKLVPPRLRSKARASTGHSIYAAGTSGETSETGENCGTALFSS